MAEEKLGTLEYEMLISQKKLEDQLEEITKKLKEEDKKWKEILSGSGTIASPKIDVANIDKLTKANKQIVLSNDQIASSIEKLKVQLSENVSNYEKLTAEQRDNEKIGGKLLATIKSQKDQLDQYNKTLRENITARKQAAQEAITQAKSEEAAKRSLESQRSKAFVKSNLDEEKRITQELKNQEAALRSLEAQRSKAFVRGELQKEKELTAEIKKQESALRSLEAQRSRAFVSSQNKLLKEEEQQRVKNLQLQKLQASIDVEQVGSIARLRAEYAKLKFQSWSEKDIDKFKEMRRQMAGIRQEIASLQPTLGFWGKLTSAIRTYVTAYLSVQGAMAIGRAVYNQTKELDALSFSMQTVIKSSTELAQTQKFLSDVAINYGGDLLTISERYVKFRAAAIQANMAASETQKIYDSVSKAAGTLGLKTDELSGVYLALEQMISKGKVTTEELRRQLGERLPGAFGIMANALGKTVPELDKMLKKGEVLSADALPKFAAALEKAYGLEAVDKIDTLAAAQGRLSTQFTELIRSVQGGDTFKNIINSIASFLGFIKDNIGVITLMSKAFISVGISITTYRLASAAAIPIQRTLLFMTGSQTSALTQLSFAQMRVVAAQRMAIAGTTAWTRAWNALKLAFVSNPLGVIITGITLLGTGLYMLSSKAKDTQRTITSFADNLSNEKAKLEQLFTSLQKAGKGTYEYKDALFQINNLYGKYLPNLLTEKSNIDEVTKARKKANEALMEEMMLRERNSRLEKATAEKDRLLSEIMNDIIAATPSMSPEKKGQVYARILDIASIGELDPDKRKKLIQKAFKGDLDAIEEYVEKATIALSGYESAVKNIDAFFAARAGGKSKTVLFDPEELKKAKEEFDKYSGLISESTKKQFIEESPYVSQAIDTYEKYLRKQLELFKDNQVARIAIENELTGLLKKGANSRVEIEEARAEAINKLNAKYLQDQEDFANYEMGIQATRIANMEDGIEKERALNQLNYENRIKAINKEREATLRLLNEAAGIAIGTDKEIKSLDATGYSPKIQRLIENARSADFQKRKNEEQLLRESNLKAEKDYQIKINEIRRDANDQFLSGLQKETAAINEKYDEWVRKAGTNIELIKDIESSRSTAISESYRQYALDRLDFEREIEYKKAEIRAKSNQNTELAEKENFEIYYKYELKRAKLLIQSGLADKQQEGRDILNKLLLDLELKSLVKQEEIRTRILEVAKELIPVVSEIFELTQQETQALSGALDAMTKAATGDLIGAAIQAGLNLINIVLGSYAENKKKRDAYYESVIEYQKEYNLLLNEQIRLGGEIDSVIFFSNLKDQISSSINALRDANDKYMAEISKLSDAQAIVGTKKVTNWKNVAGGLLIGLFVGKKEVDVLRPLLDTYPELIDENGKFNRSLAETLIKNKLVTEETAKILQNIIDWGDAAEKAKEQLNSIILGLTGQLGDSLRDSLVDAFRQGTDSAQAFGDNVEKVIENIIARMVFSTVFGAGLKKLQTEMYRSMGLQEDGKTPLTGVAAKAPEVDYNWVDDLFRFNEENADKYIEFNQKLKEARDKGLLSGMDLFGVGGGETASGISKAIQGVTEDTARRLEGLINSIRETSVINMGNVKQLVESNAMIQGYAAQSLGHLRNIDATTAAQLKLFNDLLGVPGATGKNGLRVVIQ